MANAHLTAYLSDHLAGATMAVELLDHLKTAPDSPHLQGFFAALHSDVAADRQELQDLMERLQVTESLPRKAMGWMAEQATRLKLRLDDPADGALRLLESLEFLAVGIEGKRALWRSLATVAGTVPGLQNLDYERLELRVAEQRSRVEAERLKAAESALQGTA